MNNNKYYRILWAGVTAVLLLLYSGFVTAQPEETTPIFISNADGVPKVYTLNPNTYEPELLFDPTPYGYLSGFSLSPDYQKAAFVIHKETITATEYRLDITLYILDIETRDVTQTHTGFDEIGSLTWSPDSTRLVYLTGTFPNEYGRSYIYNLSSQVRTEGVVVTPNDARLVETVIRSAVWSPDGEYFAISLSNFPPASGSFIAIAEYEGTNQYIVDLGEAKLLDHPVWDRKTGELYFFRATQTGTTIERINIATSQIQMVVTGEQTSTLNGVQIRKIYNNNDNIIFQYWNTTEMYRFNLTTQAIETIIPDEGSEVELVGVIPVSQIPTITVSPPSANAGVDQTKAASNGISTSVTLDGSGSSDLDGTITNYEWKDASGATIATGVNPQVTLAVGTHTITLKTTDNSLLSAEDTVTITVQAPPTANPGVDQTVISSNGISASVTLDGSGSSDPDGTIVSYEWKEGDTVIATGVSPTVELSSGIHEIYLTVTDDSGLSAVSEMPVRVTVEAPGRGWIAFTSARNGTDTDIYIVNPVSGYLIQMTGSFNMASFNMTDEVHPSWSRDYRKIAFAARNGATGNHDLFVVDVGTKAVRRINIDSGNQHDDYFPEWSPYVNTIPNSDKRIVFSSNRDGDRDIWLLTVTDTEPYYSDLTLVTNGADGGWADTQADWSPDGLQLVFLSNRIVSSNSDGNNEVWRMSSTGTNLVQMTNSTDSNRLPVWSSGGRYIGFTSTRSGGDYDIFYMRSNASELSGAVPVNLTKNSGIDDFMLAWSPDSTEPTTGTLPSFQIAYQRSTGIPNDADIRILTVTQGDATLEPLGAWNDPDYDDTHPSWR